METELSFGQTNFLLWVPQFLNYELWKLRIELSNLVGQTASKSHWQVLNYNKDHRWARIHGLTLSWCSVSPHYWYIGSGSNLHHLQYFTAQSCLESAVSTANWSNISVQNYPLSNSKPKFGATFEFKIGFAYPNPLQMYPHKARSNFKNS